jgi:peroxiredoxin (alkyl hydroperoxide reductase subunit C)
MAFIGKKFPNIEVNAMNEMGDTIKINVLEEAIQKNKKVLLFWYPKDFTFVCPTELHAFQEALGEFERRNTIVIGASCDTPEVHFAWLNTAKDDGGIEGLPMIFWRTVIAIWPTCWAFWIRLTFE